MSKTLKPIAMIMMEADFGEGDLSYAMSGTDDTANDVDEENEAKWPVEL